MYIGNLFLKTTTNNRKREQVWNYASVSIITTRKKAVSDPLLWLYPNISNYAAKRNDDRQNILSGRVKSSQKADRARRRAMLAVDWGIRRGLFFLRWAGPGDRHAPTGRDSRCVCLQQPADQAVASLKSLGGPHGSERILGPRGRSTESVIKVPRPTGEQTEPSPAGSTTTGPPLGPRDCV